MKKYVFFVTILIIAVIGMFLSRSSLDQILTRHFDDLRESITYTIPDEYLMLFDSQQLPKMENFRTIYNKSNSPECVLMDKGMYDIVVFKKNIDTMKTELQSLLNVIRPLRSNSLNTRRYHVLESYVGVLYAVDLGEVPIDNVLITIPDEGKFTKEVVSENRELYIISNFMKFNCFFNVVHKNPDIQIELSEQLFGRENTNVGLLLEQVGNSVFFIFVFPKSKQADPVSSNYILNIMN